MSTSSRHNALEYEIAREQAGALGMAGKQLQAAVQAYDKHVAQAGLTDGPLSERLLNEVAEKFYALLLQREFVGIAQNNIEWLERSFKLPAGVMSRLGSLHTSAGDT